MFLDKNAPQELQEAFYGRTINREFILSNPSYRDYLNNVDIECIFKYIPVSIKPDKISKVFDNGMRRRQINLIKALAQTFGGPDAIDVMLIYGKYIEKIYEENRFRNFLYDPDFTPDDFLDEIDNTILKSIIDGNMKYDENIPSHFKNNNPTLFLGENVSQEIKDKFYGRKFTLKDFSDDPELFNIFENTNVACAFPENMSWAIPLFSSYDDFKSANYNRMRAIATYYKIQDIDFQYAFKQYAIMNQKNFDINNMDKIEYILSNIKGYKVIEKYISELSDTDGLYNTLIKILGYSSCKWIIYNFKDNEKISPLDIIKIVSLYKEINDVSLQNAFREHITEYGKDIDINKIEYVSTVLSRLSLSNSSEIYAFRNELATQVLKSDNPLESLNRIEDTFIRNNIPTVGKIYSCFEILHPNFSGFNFTDSKVSPMLKKSSTLIKRVIVFSDLIKCSFGSNNKSVNAYLKNIELGSNLYESIKSGQVMFDSLGEDEKRELTTFCSHLATLYNNTMYAKQNNETYELTGDVLADMLELSKRLSPDKTQDYNLGDRVIKMFCGFAGIDTVEQAKSYIEGKLKIADSRNREAASTDMVLEQGDFVKGINDIKYLRNILQNGSVSKEYLGSSANSDSTPLDTDISMVLTKEGTIGEKILSTEAHSYGPIWFVLKNDDRFITTRKIDEVEDTRRDMSKLEVFYTGATGKGHYGIRTGFASSEINYIVTEKYDRRIGLEVAMNGFYIPVVDREGKVIFTPKDYDELRSKMNGLSYYGEDTYSFSQDLVTEETELIAQQIEQSNIEVQVKREKINSIIKKSLGELGLQLKTNIDGDLTEGYVELIDTGSTGRGTNKPGDGDFDFMMRLDRTIISNATKLNELKQTILRNLGRERTSEVTGSGDFRLKGVPIDTDMNVDIDITFTEKTDRVLYSTDMALQDRLATIQKTDFEKYKYVVANILLAKQVLKKAEAYKPNRGEVPQGGLGGVGIENWILQNGGSFITAAKSFLEAAEGKSFKEFKLSYQIWDFGDNHLAERRGLYSHDDFVANNMSEAGYQKMVKALKEYLITMELSSKEDNDTNTIK